MNLYLKTKDNTLVRTENFPITSMVIGKYVANIFYVPDEEFANAMGELNMSRTIEDKDGNKVNNEVIPIYSESGKVDLFLRPDRMREIDRADFQKVKDEKAKGNVIDLLKKQ